MFYDEYQVALLRRLLGLLFNTGDNTNLYSSLVDSLLNSEEGKWNIMLGVFLLIFLSIFLVVILLISLVNFVFYNNDSMKFENEVENSNIKNIDFKYRNVFKK